MLEKVLDLIIAALNVLYLVTRRHTCKYFPYFVFLFLFRTIFAYEKYSVQGLARWPVK